MRWLFVLFAGWAMFWSGAQAAEPLALDPEIGEYTLSDRMEWLRDGTSALDAAQADSQSGWQPLRKQPGFGFTPDAIWLRFSLDHLDARPAAWRLEIRNALLEDVRLYTRSASGGWVEQRAGRVLRHDAWPLQTRSPVFAFDLHGAGRDTVMLRVNTRTALATSVHLYESQRFLAHATQEALIWGVYFGIYGLAILIQLLFWKWTRETLSGWYVPYAGLNCLGLLLTMGYLQNQLNWEADTALHVLGLALTLALFVGVKFSSVQLELAWLMPRLNWWLTRTAAVLTAVAMLLVLGDRYGWGMSLYQVSSIGFILAFLVIAIALRLRGHEQASVFLIAFSFFYLGIAIRYMSNLGWIAPNALTENSIQIGSLAHIVAMCLFIVNRYNTLRISLRIEQEIRQQQREFIALVSHEYRTPLAIISASAQQLAAQLDGPREKSLQRCANIHNAAQRMSDLLDIYLSAERLEEAHQPLHWSSCDPRALIGQITQDWPAQRLHVTLHALPAQMVCDASLLEVALRNLLANADRHAPADSTIELRAAGDDQGGLRLSVANTGEDIPAQELPLLFQKYFRGRATRQQPGAGLGLFLVKRITDLHGAKISVSSANGRTEFSLHLPRSNPSSASERPARR